MGGLMIKANGLEDADAVSFSIKIAIQMSSEFIDSVR